jgi:hypothetical protein
MPGLESGIQFLALSYSLDYRVKPGNDGGNAGSGA